MTGKLEKNQRWQDWLLTGKCNCRLFLPVLLCSGDDSIVCMCVFVYVCGTYACMTNCILYSES